MFRTYSETFRHLTGTVVFELLNDFVVLTQLHPLFTSANNKIIIFNSYYNIVDEEIGRWVGTYRRRSEHSQAFIGRELVERKVLRAPAGVGTFVETTVHVRRHSGGVE